MHSLVHAIMARLPLNFYVGFRGQRAIMICALYTQTQFVHFDFQFASTGLTSNQQSNGDEVYITNYFISSFFSLNWLPGAPSDFHGTTDGMPPDHEYNIHWTKNHVSCYSSCDKI